MTATTPPPVAPFDPNNPKASAKAAKAYAKATRPWYKKKRWIGSIAIVAIVGIGIASSGGGDKKDDPPTSGSQPTDTEPKASEADNSSNGKGAITWGNWEVVGQLQVTKEKFTGDYAVVTRVKNTGDDPDEGLFTVTVLKGTEILGTADCFTSTVASGSVGTADCISVDKYKDGWTEITIEDSF
ncbi:MAG TPA: hypothetical protein VLI04_23610 [Nocardioidaceae bacterium]|nr:hypothetical protein [Nocardioidaceae bacterium]